MLPGLSSSAKGRAKPGEEEKSIPRHLLGAAAPALALSVLCAAAEGFQPWVRAWLCFSRLKRWKLMQEMHAGTFRLICTVKLDVYFYCKSAVST